MNSKTTIVAMACVWGALLATAVSGACYQLTNLGTGCSFDTVVSPNCVLSITTNLSQVHGTTTSGTGTGSDHATCSTVTYCVQQLGILDANGKCVASPPPNGWTSTTSGLSCTLDGKVCQMVANP